MNKLQHLKQVKTYLRKVAAYRRQLINSRKSYRPELSMQQALLEVDYRVGDIKSFDNMMAYIGQQKTRVTIELLVPKNKPGWLEEFDRLVYLGKVLQGKIVKARQTEFSF